VDKSSLIRSIEVVFDGVARADTSLRQFLLTDEFGMSREITAEEWTAAGISRIDLAWQDIPDEEIKVCGYQLAHMESIDFLYYVPAYMRYALINCYRPIWETDIPFMTVISLSLSSENKDLCEYQLRKYSALNTAQERVVVQFLEFFAQIEDRAEYPEAKIALSRYWRRS
jgi:hypothetical protein